MFFQEPTIHPSKPVSVARKDKEEDFIEIVLWHSDKEGNELAWSQIARKKDSKPRNSGKNYEN